MQTAGHNSMVDSPQVTAPSRLVLTGFMGAGKSTVGRALAKRLGWKFLDLDEIIVEAEGRSIADLFADLGEAGFREQERIALASALKENSTVLALGGGAVETAANRELLRTTPNTQVIFLEAPLGVLLQRCEQQIAPGSAVRPVLADPALLERYALRLPYYRDAHHTFTTAGREPAEIVESILTTISSGSKSISHS